MTKFVFVTGGVLSGIGKGVTSAAIGKLFQFRGLEVDMIKADPYLNVDPGTLNPIEHGEVFVTDEVWEFKPSEGFSFSIAEIDQDFGTYERFLDKTVHPRNNVTSGQVYLATLLQERAGGFLGRTVQIIPHITDEIKRRIRRVAERGSPDVLITELGGTVGDIEASPFLEAVRQFKLEERFDQVALVHVTLVPYLETIGQLKTKPTQHSVKTLLSAGLQPDVIVARGEKPLTDPARDKISLYSNVPSEAVISNPDTSEIYEIPLRFERQGLGDYLCDHFRFRARSPNLSSWKDMALKFKKEKESVRIAMPGKYTQIMDSYVSINEALEHAAVNSDAKARIEFVDTEPIEEDLSKLDILENYHGILLTPGFGTRGAEGMIKVAQKAMDSKIPFLGICFGAQLFFIAFCRRMGLNGANSAEIDPEAEHPVVDLLPEQKKISEKGGTMRLGGHEIVLKPGTKLFKAYGKKRVVERFRHRYHLIPEYAHRFEGGGLVISAMDKDRRIINAIEIEGDHWMVGTQFHPEFTSRPEKPSPIYSDFISAALKRKRRESKKS
ncbi:CTP synthetase [candidate division MSBL1 archaeon SCGC-AAA261D19]|uniref:CTP synthase (glutamine hydrolyzing) n=2 Tax=candidate division MSBL1 TaxID=215777 RepID=A0A133V8V5_9EURY|nr:CTP synthetase [candidate division MSBL1 archaeon SCGC-AAA261D19]